MRGWGGCGVKAGKGWARAGGGARGRSRMVDGLGKGVISRMADSAGRSMWGCAAEGCMDGASCSL